MKIYVLILYALLILTGVPTHAQSNPPMKLIQSIPLPNVEGYFDHMAVDLKGQRSVCARRTPAHH